MSDWKIPNIGENLPEAPPDSIRNAVQDIYTEFSKFQNEKEEWRLERSKLRSRVIQLEGEARKQEKEVVELRKRIEILEHSLAAERRKHAIPKSKLVRRRTLKDIESVSEGVGDSENGVGLDYRIHKTVPKNFMSSSSKENLNFSSPSRFLTIGNNISKHEKRQLKLALGESAPSSPHVSTPNGEQVIEKDRKSRSHRYLFLSDEENLGDPSSPISLTSSLPSHKIHQIQNLFKSSSLHRSPQPSKRTSYDSLGLGLSRSSEFNVIDNENEHSLKASKSSNVYSLNLLSEGKQKGGRIRSSDDTKIYSQQHSKLITNKWKTNLTLKSHLDGVRSIDFHPRDAVLISGSEDSTMKLWNIQSLTIHGKKKKVLDPDWTFRGHKGWVTSCTWDVDENNAGCDRLLSADIDGRIIVWRDPKIESDEDLNSNFKLFTLNDKRDVHSDAVWKIITTNIQSKTFLFSAGSDGAVAVWDIPRDANNALDVKLINRFEYKGLTSNLFGSIRKPICLGISSLEKHHILIGFDSGELCEYDFVAGKIIKIINPTPFISSSGGKDENTLPESNVSPSKMLDLDCHPTLPMVISSHADGFVRLFDISQGTCIRSIQTHSNAVSSLTIDRSGHFMATSSHDQSIRIWDLGSKKMIQDISQSFTHRRKYGESIHCVRYHPSMSLLASCGADSIVKVYR